MIHDPTATPTALFPRLSPTNHHITSPADRVYNCIAWAVGDTARWWQPDEYWPVPVDPEARSVAELIRAYAAVGFEPCGPGEPDPTGYEVIAVYAVDPGEYLHAARRLPSGK